MIKQKTQHKIDIFDVIRNIDIKNKQYFQSLSEEEQKSISPFVIMRWLTGSNNARQVYFLNEVVNPYAFSLQKHKELLMQLMMVCTSGHQERYKWIKQIKKKSHSTPTLLKLVQTYFGYNSAHATDVIPLLSNDDILSYAEQLGYQIDVIKVLKRELKKRE